MSTKIQEGPGLTDNKELMGKLATLEDRINSKESIIARWEFGRLLLDQKDGKQLPSGLRAQIAEEFEINSTEITRRMKLAKEFPTKSEVEHACTSCDDKWRRVIREHLTKPRTRTVETDWTEQMRERLRKIREKAITDGHADILRRLLSDELSKLGECEPKAVAA